MCVCVCVCVCVCARAFYSPVKPRVGNNSVRTKNHSTMNISPLFYCLPPFPPVSILTVIISSIRSEEVLLFLVLLIHINIHNRMEINL